ncbi:cystin-1 [Excalfactoria chinensis]|uniref:cystin-1 n=1 Tax=Excalfactoria chinensis TaxID=46218 RepID=UPI003B3A08AD
MVHQSAEVRTLSLTSLVTRTWSTGFWPQKSSLLCLQNGQEPHCCRAQPAAVIRPPADVTRRGREREPATSERLRAGKQMSNGTGLPGSFGSTGASEYPVRSLPPPPLSHILAPHHPRARPSRPGSGPPRGEAALGDVPDSGPGSGAAAMGSGSSRRRGRAGGAPRGTVRAEAAGPLPATEERRAPGTALEAAPPGPAQPAPEASSPRRPSGPENNNISNECPSQGSKQPVGCPAILYHGSEEELMASIEREYGC